MSTIPRMEPGTGIAAVDRNRVDVVTRELDRGHEAVEAARARRRQGFLRQLLDPEARKAKEMELALIQDEFEFRRRALKGVREVQLKALEAMANTYSGNINCSSRADLVVVITRKRVELQGEIDQLYADFNERLEEGYRRAAKIQRASLRVLEEERLDNAAFEVKELVETIIRQFATSVTEQIKV